MATKKLINEALANTVEIPGTNGLLRSGTITELSVFEENGTNRTVDTSRADKIGVTFEQTTMNINPVTGDKNFKIVDGHHRTYIARQLGLPLYFQVYTGTLTGEELMKLLNINMKNWSLEDFFLHNSKDRIPGYLEALKIQRRHDIDLSSLERFLPVTTSQIKKSTPFDVPDDIEYKITTAISIKEAERKVLTNSRRLYKWASAMILFENKIKSRIECYGSVKLATAWKEDGFEKIIKDLPKILIKTTANDGTEELAHLLSLAFDYRRKNKFDTI